MLVDLVQSYPNHTVYADEVSKDRADILFALELKRMVEHRHNETRRYGGMPISYKGQMVRDEGQNVERWELTPAGRETARELMLTMTVVRVGDKLMTL